MYKLNDQLKTSCKNQFGSYTDGAQLKYLPAGVGIEVDIQHYGAQRGACDQRKKFLSYQNGIFSVPKSEKSCLEKGESRLETNRNEF